MRTNLKRPPMLLFSNWLRSLNGRNHLYHKWYFLWGMHVVGRISPHGRLSALTKTSLCCRSLSALRRESSWTNKKFLDRKCVGAEQNMEAHAKAPESVIWYLLQASLRREWVWSFCRLYAVLITKVKHVADGDDDKPTLRNYAKGGVRFDLISKREPINRTAVSSAFPVTEAAL